MAITTMDGLVAALASAQGQGIIKNGTAAKAAGSFQSLWTAAGTPTAGAAAGSAAGAVCTSATEGAVPFTNPAAGASYLARLVAAMSQPGTLVIYDRLVHTSALSGTVTTAQTVGTPALTRATDGLGVELWLEIYTATGSTAVQATASYTDDTNTSRTTPTKTGNFIATPAVGQMIPLPLASGSKGVKSVQSVTLSATTGTAGNFGVTLLKRLATVPCPVANIANLLDFASTGLAVIPDNACLAFFYMASATTALVLSGGFDIAQG